MSDYGAKSIGLPSRSEIEATESYCERRQRLHDCMTFKVPTEVSVLGRNSQALVLISIDLPQRLSSWSFSNGKITARSIISYQRLLELQISLLYCVVEQIPEQFDS